MPKSNKTVPPCAFSPLIQTCMNPASFQGGYHPNWNSWKSAKEMLMNTHFPTTVVWVLVVGCWCSLSSWVPLQTGYEEKTMRRGELNSSSQKSYERKGRGKQDRNAPTIVTCFIQYTECYVSIALHCIFFYWYRNFSLQQEKKITLKSGGKACSILVVCWLSLLNFWLKRWILGSGHFSKCSFYKELCISCVNPGMTVPELAFTYHFHIL